MNAVDDTTKKLENFEKLLSANLGRVLDLLKFAEAKNGALLTFCSAWILGLIAVLRNPPSPDFYRDHLVYCIILFVLAAMASIASLLPRANLSRFYTPTARSQGLLFFGDIALLGTDEFVKGVKVRYFDRSDDAFSIEYINDLTVQISVTSKIAQQKFLIFNVGAAVAMAAICVAAAPYIIIIAQTITSHLGSQR